VQFRSGKSIAYTSFGKQSFVWLETASPGLVAMTKALDARLDAIGALSDAHGGHERDSAQQVDALRNSRATAQRLHGDHQ